MAKNKVLFLITKATWGGAQKYVYDLATRLPQSDLDVVVAYGRGGMLAERLAKANIRTIALPSLDRDVSILSDMRSLFDIYRCIRAERPDVIHLNSSKVSALGALAARLCGAPRIVFTAHGWPFKERRNLPARAFIYLLSWLTALASHVVIVVSRTDEHMGERMPGTAHKIVYIPLGVETPDLLSREDASRRLSIATPMPRIVTNAELTANKGIGFALQATALLKERGTDVSYFIIGDGEDRAILEAQVRSLGITDRVLFLGFVPEAARYLSAFDAFVLPSIKEGMPYVLLEAAAAGMPIVATNVVDPSFFKTCAYARAVGPADATALADGITATLARKTAPNEPSAQPLHSIGQMLNATLETYNAPRNSVSSRA